MTRRFKSLKIWSTFILLHKSCPIRDADLYTAHIWSNINFQDKSPCPLYLVQLYHKCLSQFSLLGLCSSLKATVAAEMGLWRGSKEVNVTGKTFYSSGKKTWWIIPFMKKCRSFLRLSAIRDKRHFSQVCKVSCGLTEIFLAVVVGSSSKYDVWKKKY